MPGLYLIWMWRRSGAAKHGYIGHVCDCFRKHAKKGGAVLETHGQGEVKADNFLFLFPIFWDDEDGGGCVLDTESQVHVCMLQVYLAKLDWAETGV